MPGVPPDALAQVKRGLRGLFGRKKRQQQEQQQQQETQQQKPTQTSNPTPTITTTAPPAAAQDFATNNEAQAPKTGGSIDQVPSPPAPTPGATPTVPASTSGAPPPEAIQTPAPTTENSKLVDSTPTTTTAASGGHQHIPAPTQISGADSMSPNPTAPASASAEPTATATAPRTVAEGGDGAMGKKADEGGMMSATSGPLSLTDDPMAHGYADEKLVNRGVAAEGVGK
ncbi:MAG: hypothetical protein Q9226_003635 [Calogaya cf. arnoldii]